MLKDAEQELFLSKEARLKLEEKCKDTADKLNALDKEAAQVKHELNAQVEELKMKVFVKTFGSDVIITTFCTTAL